MNEKELLVEVHTKVGSIEKFVEKFPEECERRYASKERVERVEFFQKLVMTGITAWLITNLLGLITKTQAAINVIF